MSRPRQVAVIGPARCESDSEAAQLGEDVGRLLAEAGVTLVCGGMGGTMEAACLGARGAGGESIGIVPGQEVGEANEFCTHVVAGLRELGSARGAYNPPAVAADRLLAAADAPERTLAAVRSTFRGAANVELLSTRVGVRPMPADGEPIVGPIAEVPGLYLAVMHSAVTLAPAVGRLVALELVDGVVEPALAGCRLDRY